jgi:predicted Rossmann fold flavoprotein
MVKPETLNVAVVGGGPAGLTAAVHAAKRGARVALFDRKRVPGEKIALSGGGRCNILPTATRPDAYETDSSKHTLRKILLSWPLASVRSYLERDVGLPLREEVETGKLFPAAGGGDAVRQRLLLMARQAGAELRCGASVEGVDPGTPHRIRLEGGETALAERVILATGGLSYSQTGSDGLGLEIARALGHELVEPYEALVPLSGDLPAHWALAGLSVPVALAATDGTRRSRTSGPLLFTHRGYSGPAVLDVSHLAARASREGRRARIAVSWGNRPAGEWAARLSEGRRLVRNAVAEVLPDRLAACLVSELGLDDARCDTCSKANRRRLIEALTSYPLLWRATGGFTEAEVTGGGVKLSDVDPRTLESRIAPGVHFCGEILDAFGPIGGHNFLWAFVTGKLAGEAAGQPG